MSRHSSEAARAEEPHVSIVVMAFNEAQSLVEVVSEISQTMLESRFRSEVIIVDDGSTDGTGALADRLSNSIANVVALHHEVNRGIGEVYASGFHHARGAFLTFLPADGQFPAEIVPRFAEMMQGRDIVLGYLPDVGRKRILMARGLSSLERLFFRTLFGQLPRFQGVMMFRRELLEWLDVRPAGRSWGVLTELVVKAKRAGCIMVSEPTPLRARVAGRSKVNNLSTIWANLKQAVQLRVALFRWDPPKRARPA